MQLVFDESVGVNVKVDLVAGFAISTGGIAVLTWRPKGVKFGCPLDLSLETGTCYALVDPITKKAVSLISPWGVAGNLEPWRVYWICPYEDMIPVSKKNEPVAS